MNSHFASEIHCINHCGITIQIAWDNGIPLLYDLMVEPDQPEYFPYLEKTLHHIWLLDLGHCQFLGKYSNQVIVHISLQTTHHTNKLCHGKDDTSMLEEFLEH